MQVKIPNEPFNALVRNNTAGATIGNILDSIKPEAVYFSEMSGQRGAILIVDVADPSKVPGLAEPFFLKFNATVEFHIVMTQDDLKASGLEQLGKKWS